MTISISASVGQGGANKPDDVATVQMLFNKFLTTKLTESKECPADGGTRTSTGSVPQAGTSTSPGLQAGKKGPPQALDAAKCWPQTVKAIVDFQTECARKGFTGFGKPDGKIGPGGATWRRLVAAADELGQGRSVILTFDDGPEPVADLKTILNTLRTNNIKAEFYVQGDEVKSSPDAAKLIVTDGHVIQNHTYDHPKDIDLLPEGKVRGEVKSAQDEIKKATGVAPTKVRPPYGSGGWPGMIDPELGAVAKELSLKVENWNIDTRDWEAPLGLIPTGLPGEKKLDSIAEQFWIRGQPQTLVVLMHVLPGTARDLPAFIAQLKKWGFTFSNPV